MRLFPATEGPRAAPSESNGIDYDFNRAGFEAEDLTSWLNTQGIPATFAKPFPWRSVLTAGTGVALAVVLAVMVGPQIGGVLQGSKILWELLTLGTVIIMCSGYMWNQIRSAPYNGIGQNGKIEYVAGGFQNQFVAETQIVACICKWALIDSIPGRLR